MATTTMTTVDNLLKEVYEPDLHDQIESDTITLKRIERSSEGVTHEVGGKYVRFPLRVRRNHGIGARNENEALPIARTQKYENAYVRLKNLYGAIELTGQTFELADKNFQAFASVLDQEVNGMKEGLVKDTNRQVYGDGSGTLVTATAIGTTTTLITDNAQYMEEGMFVDVYTSADAVRVADVEVTDVVDNGDGTSTVTFSPAAGAATAVGDYMTRDNSRNKELTGLGAIVNDTGELYGVDPATTRVWAATIDDNGGVNRALSEGLMIGMVQKIKRKGGGYPTVGFASDGVMRSYFNLLVQQRRTTNTQEFTGGYRGLSFVTDGGEIPIVSDGDAPPGTLSFVNEKQIKLYEAGDWSFMDRDGSKWQRVINSAGSFDAYEAKLYKYAEIGTHRRNAHGQIRDITEG